jgi:rod shape-determining protein MreD
MLKIGVILAAAFIESSLSDFLTWNGARPDFILLLVVSSGLLEGPGRGLVSGAAGGIFLGLFSDYPSGIFMLSYGVIGWISGLIRERIYTDTLLVSFLSSGIMTLLNLGLSHLLYCLFLGYSSLDLADLWWRILLLNLTFSLPVFSVFRLIRSSLKN